MEVVASVEVPVSAQKLFNFVADLANYSSWLDFVHKVDLVVEPNNDGPTWLVELRARLGLLARSKRLRMTRTVFQSPNLVVFERRENDSRRHAEWVLRATITNTADGALLHMSLHYSGSLFTGGAMERALTEQIDTGRERLIKLLSAS